MLIDRNHSAPIMTSRRGHVARRDMPKASVPKVSASDVPDAMPNSLAIERHHRAAECELRLRGELRRDHQPEVSISR
jgi:hypothetical protein